MRLQRFDGQSVLSRDRPHSGGCSRVLLCSHEYTASYRCPSSFVRWRWLLLWRACHRRKRGWSYSVDMLDRLFGGRMAGEKLEPVRGEPMTSPAPNSIRDDRFFAILQWALIFLAVGMVESCSVSPGAPAPQSESRTSSVFYSSPCFWRSIF